MNPIQKLRAKPGYKWVVVCACFAMVMICLGFCSSTKQMYLAATTNALKLERALFSLNDSIRFITSAVVNMFFGTLVMRFGPRKMIGAGFGCLIASMLIYSFAEKIYIFYIGGALLGMGLSWTTTTMVGYVVSHWCKENKGTIMGAVLAANGLGGALSAQVISPIIESGLFGYRTAYRVTAILLAVVGITVVALFKNEPEGVARSAHQKKKAKAGTWSGISFRECLRKPYFYAAIACVFCFGLITTCSNGVYVAHMKDVGLDAGYVATIVSIHSLALTLFKFLTGISYDKFGLRVSVIICCLASICSCLLLSSVSNTPAGMAIAMCQGVIGSLAQPLETVMIPLIAAELFGEKSFSNVMGIMVSVNAIGCAIGAPLSNWFYDTQGTYRFGLLLVAAVMAVIIVVFQFVLSAAHKQKKLLAAAEK